MSYCRCVPTTSESLRFATLVTGTAGFLDAYTYLDRGGVFANAQTGNVILGAVDLAGGQWGAALRHLWPILAFFIGITLAIHIKRGRLDGVLRYPIRITIAAQAGILLVIGFLPDTVNDSFITVPIAFLCAMQMELFRTIGDYNYMAIATTGNLMRLVEAAYGFVADRTSAARGALRVYTVVVFCFGLGAVVGAVITHFLHGHAAWVGAGILAVTLILFVVDERRDD